MKKGVERLEHFERMERYSFRNFQILPNRHRFLTVAISGAAVPDGKGDGHGRARSQCHGSFTGRGQRSAEHDL